MLGSPEGLARNQGQGASAGMAVEDVQMVENPDWLTPGGSSPTRREVQTLEISTPAPSSRDTILMEGLYDENGAGGDPSRQHEKMRDEIMRLIRETDDLRLMVDRHEKRQVLVDSFHEELDQLHKQMTGITLELPSKEVIVDISHAVIQGYDLSQIESNQKRDEEARCITEAFEKVKSETRDQVERAREEIQDGVDACTSEITARTAKIVEGESETRRRGFKRVDATLGVLTTRVDGLQESIIRCRNETSSVKTMFNDFRKHYDDCVPRGVS